MAAVFRPGPTTMAYASLLAEVLLNQRVANDMMDDGVDIEPAVVPCEIREIRVVSCEIRSIDALLDALGIPEDASDEGDACEGGFCRDPFYDELLVLTDDYEGYAEVLAGVLRWLQWVHAVRPAMGVAPGVN